MFYKKYRLLPVDEEGEGEKRNPFENTHAQRARVALAELQRDASNNSPTSSKDRVERQQKLLQYKNDFKTSIEKSRFGSLQETLDHTDGKESQISNLESMFKDFLDRQIVTEKTPKVIPKSRARNDSEEYKKQKGKYPEVKNTSSRILPYPTPKKSQRTSRQKILENYSPPVLRRKLKPIDLKLKQQPRVVLDASTWRNVH